MSGDVVGDLACGVFAGTCGKVVDYPLDTVKTRLQNPAARYAGAIDCIKQTAQKEGIRGFYSGLGAPIAGAAAEKAIVFTAYNAGKRVYDVFTTAFGIHTETPGAPDTITKCVIAGGLSGVATAVILTPVELLKCRVQIDPRHPSLRSIGNEIVQKYGLIGLYHGHTATVARESFGNLFWFGLYESIIRAGLKSQGKTKREEAGASLFMGAGGAAGVAFWTAAFPFDTVKTQMQINEEARQRGVIRGIAHIAKNQGLGALFRGWNVTAVRAFPANACVFAAYEASASAWRGHFHEPHHLRHPHHGQPKPAAPDVSA